MDDPANMQFIIYLPFVCYFYFYLYERKKKIQEGQEGKRGESPLFRKKYQLFRNYKFSFFDSFFFFFSPFIKKNKLLHFTSPCHLLVNCRIKFLRQF